MYTNVINNHFFSNRQWKNEFFSYALAATLQILFQSFQIKRSLARMSGKAQVKIPDSKNMEQTQSAIGLFIYTIRKQNNITAGANQQTVRC